MKVEKKKKQDKPEDSLMQMEVAVLKMFQQYGRTSHVCEYFGQGDTLLFRYVVMELVGKCLNDLRKKQIDCQFSESTTIRLAIQIMEGIESLHRIGFLHRDIKQANMAIGREEKARMVYILDFGLARQYITSEGELSRHAKSDPE